jgi:hypothetical protein
VAVMWETQCSKVAAWRCWRAGHQGSRVKSFATSGDGSVGVMVLFDSSISVWDLQAMQVGPCACLLLPTINVACALAKQGRCRMGAGKESCVMMAALFESTCHKPPCSCAADACMLPCG